jgi:hypothetical protein
VFTILLPSMHQRPVPSMHLGRGQPDDSSG